MKSQYQKCLPIETKRPALPLAATLILVIALALCRPAHAGFRHLSTLEYTGSGEHASNVQAIAMVEVSNSVSYYPDLVIGGQLVGTKCYLVTTHFYLGTLPGQFNACVPGDTLHLGISVPEYDLKVGFAFLVLLKKDPAVLNDHYLLFGGPYASTHLTNCAPDYSSCTVDDVTSPSNFPNGSLMSFDQMCELGAGFCVAQSPPPAWPHE